MSRFNSRKPRYNDDSDYTTNAPSYYDFLGKMKKQFNIVTDYVNKLLKRNIKFEESSTIDFSEDGGWDITNDNDEIKIKASVKTSLYNEEITLENVNQYIQLKNSIEEKEDGLWSPDYLEAIRLLDNEISNIIMKSVNNREPVLTPEHFTWKDHPLENKVYRDNNGNVTHDFDVSIYRPFGKRYYVDPNVSASGDGLTLETAFKTMGEALHQNDIVEMVLANGIYLRDNVLWGNSNYVTKDISIMAMEGHKPLLCSGVPISYTLNETYNNVYQATTGTCTNVVDIKNTNINGDFTLFTRVTSLEEVSMTYGSWFHDGTTLYIKTFDGRVPDDNIIRCTGGRAIEQVGDCVVYLEGLTFIEGNSGLTVRNLPNVRAPRIFSKNCRFLYSSSDGWNVVSLQGVELSIFQKCEFSHGQKDGIHYSALNGVQSFGVEIECYGGNNGVLGTSNNQSSTAHNSCKVIRLLCNYYGNYGNNIGDSGIGVETWNIACISHNAKADNPGQNTNYMVYDDTTMFIEDCLGYDSLNDIGGGGTAYIKNNNLLSETKIQNRTNVIYY